MICSKFKSIFSILAIISLIVGLSSGCGIFPKEETALAPPLIAPKKQEYKLYKISKGTIEKKFTGNGTLISAALNSVYFKDNSKRVKHINVKVGDIVKKGDILVETEAGNIDTQVKIQAYNVQLNEIDYNDIKGKAGASPSDLEKLRLRLLIEKTKLDDLRGQQQSSRLISPISGQVIFVENIKDGENVDPYKTIVTVGDPKNLMVYCNSKDIQNLNIGMKAKVNVNDQKLEGVIISTPASSQLTKDETAKNGVSIRFINMPTGVKIGDFANIEVALETKNNTLVIPKNAVKVFSNTRSVETWDGTSKKELTVETGIETPAQIEIISGVNEGQNIIVN
ncbi:MAG: efflux RND transporter periplasmic adaptor subunit [Clostridiaceae bacterium]|nr:efflux RND transporter periplasmic adaptor subunit [Clostridiaceae bacterium]